MPRPLLGPQFESIGRLGATHAGGPVTTGAILTGPRSSRYVAAIKRLDASATLRQADLDTIIDDLHREFTDKWSSVPLGFVAHCYLGPPYEAHTVTVDGAIIEHYETGRALPGQLERARALARTEHYLVIEVYPERLVCVRDDGSVTVMGA